MPFSKGNKGPKRRAHRLKTRYTNQEVRKSENHFELERKDKEQTIQLSKGISK
jgi:hypothetical protein